MKSLFLTIFICLIILAPLTMSQALDLGQDSYLEELAGTAGFQIETVQSQAYLDSTIGRILAGIFTLISVSFLSLIIISGFQWINAQGNDEVAKKARDRVLHATIGLFIIGASYLISFFIYNSINSSVTGENQEFNPEPALECQNNSDCSDSSYGPFCDYNGATGYCGECAVDQNCLPGNPKCYLPIWGHSVCGECGDDEDCPDDELCNIGTCE